MTARAGGARNRQNHPPGAAYTGARRFQGAPGAGRGALAGAPRSVIMSVIWRKYPTYTHIPQATPPAGRPRRIPTYDIPREACSNYTYYT